MLNVKKAARAPEGRALAGYAAHEGGKAAKKPSRSSHTIIVMTAAVP
jgi:hypothetical protein